MFNSLTRDLSAYFTLALTLTMMKCKILQVLYRHYILIYLLQLKYHSLNDMIYIFCISQDI